MTSSKYTYHTAAAIPSELSPKDIISALHEHRTCLMLQELKSDYEPLLSARPEVVNDGFWSPDDTETLATYNVTGNISYLPWFSWSTYELAFPTSLQNTSNGLKMRADTSGVVLRAHFRVIEGGTIESEVEGEGEGLGQVDWVLVEDVEIECSWWIMPLVRSKMEGAHQDICRKMVNLVAEEKIREAATAAIVNRDAKTGNPPVDEQQENLEL